MTSLLDPREVYQYLQELGYKNISPKQLKDFLKDLKKLIKYDERIHDIPKNESKENIQPNNSDNSHIFENLYVNKTAASKAKEVAKKEKVICVQIKKHKDTCRHKNTEEEREIEDLISVREKLVTSSVTLGGSSQQTNASEKTIVSQDEKLPSNPESSKQSLVHNGGLKPKASFIRPKSYTRIGKSDPVALYHQYQAEWKRQREKIPGETNHSSLRWVIREKMMG